MDPVPPFVLRIPANFRMTSFAEVHPFNFPVNFTPQGYCDDHHIPMCMSQYLTENIYLRL